MTQVKSGAKVSVHYTGKIADGTIFDSTVGEEPMTFTFGEVDFIDGFVDALQGMSVGEKKSVTLTPEEAYGERNEEMVIDVPLSEIPDDLELVLDDELEITGEDDEPLLVTVVKLSEDTVTLDGNAPLAGETLTFDIEVVSID